MKLPRPHIPTYVRLQVASRMMRDKGMMPTLIQVFANCDSAREKLSTCLEFLFPAGGKVHLDHDPALCLRPYNKRTGKYSPDANHPKYLIYRTKTEHDIKTRVRGDGAQLSDLALRRKNKRIAKRILTGKRPKYGVAK